MQPARVPRRAGAASLGLWAFWRSPAVSHEIIHRSRCRTLFLCISARRHCYNEYMVKKSYARLGKLAHTAASPLLRVYMKGRHRVRTVVANDQDELLLVRSWFGHQRWSLPGGGIRRSERSVQAALRETFEETGVTIDERSCRYLGEFINGDSSAPFIVECFVAHVSKQPAHIAARHRLEMLDVAWFSMKHLPAHRSQTVDRAMELYRTRS